MRRDSSGDSMNSMKILLSGSFSARDKILEMVTELEDLGHEVESPNFGYEIVHGKVDTAEEKARLMSAYFPKIEWCDAVLAVNVDKRRIENYIGGNTLIELAVAFYLKKKIFLLNPIPDLPYAEEIAGMMPVIIDKDLEKIS